MIQLRGVGKRYEDVAVLAGLDLTIEAGDFAFLQGESGSGKSTLLQILYRDIEDYEGEVLVDGQSIRSMPKHMTRRLISVIFQSFELLERKTVIENIVLAGQILGKEESGLYRDARRLLQLVGLSDKENRFPGQLSYGEQQRTAIARALLNRPKVLLADEPTGNLDSANARKIISLLKEINEKEQIAMLIVTHSQELPREFLSRNLYMTGGRVLEHE